MHCMGFVKCFFFFFFFSSLNHCVWFYVRVWKGYQFRNFIHFGLSKIICFFCFCEWLRAWVVVCGVDDLNFCLKCCFSVILSILNMNGVLFHMGYRLHVHGYIFVVVFDTCMYKYAPKSGWEMYFCSFFIHIHFKILLLLQQTPTLARKHRHRQQLYSIFN